MIVPSRCRRHWAGGERGVQTNSTFIGITSLQFRSPLLRDETPLPSNSPQQQDSPNITRPRKHLSTQAPCATLSLPGTSGAETFLFLGPGHDRGRPSRRKLPRPQPRLERVSRRSYATSSVKRSQRNCSWSRLTSCRGKQGVDLMAALRRRGVRVVADHQFAGVHGRG